MHRVVVVLTPSTRVHSEPSRLLMTDLGFFPDQTISDQYTWHHRVMAESELFSKGSKKFKAKVSSFDCQVRCCPAEHCK